MPSMDQTNSFISMDFHSVSADQHFFCNRFSSEIWLHNCNTTTQHFSGGTTQMPRTFVTRWKRFLCLEWEDKFVLAVFVQSWCVVCQTFGKIGKNLPVCSFLLQRNNIPKDYRILVHYVPKEKVRFCVVCLQYFQGNNRCRPLFTCDQWKFILWLVFPQLHLCATLGWPYKYCTMHLLCSAKRSLNFNVTSV